MATAIYTAVLLLAQSDGAGRGDNPSEAGGLLVIVGAIVAAGVVIAAATYLMARVTARRRDGGDRKPGREG